MTNFLIILAFISTAIIACPLITLFHELGHGMAALLLTRDRVTLYIGSYGDKDQSRSFRIKRLELFFKRNPFLWTRGLCLTHDKEVTHARKMLIIACGPITSLLISVSCWYITFASALPGIVKIIAFIFLASSLFDFFLNAIPGNRTVRLFNGTITYNDGRQLKELFKNKSIRSRYKAAAVHYNNKEYKQAARIFHDIIRRDFKNVDIYRLAITSYLQFKDYETARNLTMEFEKSFEPESNDYLTSGIIKAQLTAYDEAISDYQKALELNPGNSLALNNRGYTYNLMELYDEAIADFDRAIEIDSKFAYSYNNRGLSKIKSGQSADGLRDIETSIALDEKNAYAYRNLGIYHFDRGNFGRAHEYFQRAYALDPDTHLLSEYIEKTQQMTDL